MCKKLEQLLTLPQMNEGRKRALPKEMHRLHLVNQRTGSELAQPLQTLTSKDHTQQHRAEGQTKDLLIPCKLHKDTQRQTAAASDSIPCGSLQDRAGDLRTEVRHRSARGD